MLIGKELKNLKNEIPLFTKMDNSIKILASTNFFKSSDLSFAKNFTRIETKTINLQPGMTVFDYISYDDLKYAAEWELDQFTYNINEFGFRFDNKNTEADIAVFGCSFTFGTGLPASCLWHEFLSKELNMSCLNFGVPGASIKTVTDIFKIASSCIKFKKAVFLLPACSRSQIAKKDPLTDTINFLSIIPGHKSMLAEYYGIQSNDIYKYVPDEERYKTVRDELYTIEYIARTKEIELYYGTWEPETGDFLNEMNFDYAKKLPRWYTPPNLVNDFARDKRHPGIEHHKFWANEIKDFIK